MTRSNVEVPYPYNDSPTTLAELQAWQEVVNKKLNVSVTDFGAVGDGVTDDTQAIQNAIDSVAAAGGGVVYFPDGTYLGNEVKSDFGVYWIWGISGNYVELHFAPNATLKTEQSDSVVLVLAMGEYLVDGSEVGDYWIGKTDTNTYYDLDPIALNDPYITLQNLSDADNFAAGDYVFIRTGQLLSASTQQPDCEINRVAKVDGDKLYLCHPTSKPYEQEYFISGTSGVTSTSVTANAALFGVAKITDRCLVGFKSIGMNYEMPDDNINAPIYAQSFYDLEVTDHSGFGGGHGISGNCGRISRFRRWNHQSNASGSGYPRYVCGLGFGATDGEWESIRGVATGDRGLILHIHEGLADIHCRNIQVYSPAGADSWLNSYPALSIRSRCGPNITIDDSLFVTESTYHAAFADETCVRTEGCRMNNVAAVCAASDKGILVAADGWEIDVDEDQVVRYYTGVPLPKLSTGTRVDSVETISRKTGMVDTLSLTSGYLRVVSLLEGLRPGWRYDYIDVYSGSTASSGLTHSWVCLIDLDTNEIIAVSPDDTGSWSANTSRRFTFTSPYYSEVPIDHPAVGLCVTATTTMPTMLGTFIPSSSGLMHSVSPLAGGGQSGYSTPPSVGSSVTLTASGTLYYAALHAKYS